MGKLVVTGSIRLAQFWSEPGGNSDADTTKVAVEAITFDGQPRTVFDGAYVVADGRHNLVVYRGEVTLRYQGIDAPELHYSAPVAGSPNLRQWYGESSTRALLAFLKSKANGSDTLPCQIQTEVERPIDVFDVYGRMIGDIVVDGG